MIPHVTILMATFNGADYLPEQLESFSEQTWPSWSLLVSDDGSEDHSILQLEAFARKMSQKGISVDCLQGPCTGAAANFLFLMQRPEVASAQWIAFSDQDDVWFPDKLERGLAALEDVSGPALYCTRTRIFDPVSAKNGRLSPLHPREPSFRNALVQNIASGNTIMLNRDAAELVHLASQEVNSFVVHDWWIYQLITGVGGTVVMDEMPSLHYRQHAGNYIGANDTAWARSKRVWKILNGEFKRWNKMNAAALKCSSHRLTHENQILLDKFFRFGERSLLNRMCEMRRLRLYRQSYISTVALWIAVILGKI